MWYELDNIEKRGKLFNWIVTGRGSGKTTAIKKRIVEKGLEGKKSVYIRRNKVECENRRMKDFFSKIQSLGYYSEYSLEYDHHEFKCDGQVIGYAVPLSTSVNERSIDYIGVTDIYFEEFVLREDDKHHYLKNEVELFLELYVTISRNTDVRVWFVGNNIETFNPYFLYFNIYPEKEGIKCWKDHAIEFYRNEEFEKMVSDTRFGKLISDTPYGDYSIKNSSLMVQKQFIRKRPKATTPLFNIIYMSKKYGVYGSRNCTIFIDELPNNKQDISFTKNDNNTSNVTWKAFRTTFECKFYIQALKNNSIFYSSEKTEQIGRTVNRILYFI